MGSTGAGALAIGAVDPVARVGDEGSISGLVPVLNVPDEDEGATLLGVGGAGDVPLA